MSACRQSWRVEAARDGRLAAAESASFAEHAQSCFQCDAEATRLAKLGEALRQIPVAEPNTFAVRSARRRLLEAAATMSNGRQLAHRRVHRPAAFRVWLAAAAAVLLVAAGVRYAPRSHAPAALAPSPDPVVSAMAAAIEVRAAADAQWTHRSEPSAERIALDEGTLWVKVAHDASHQRLVFRVPDGEIADIGTTFTVTVRDGRTRRVTVEEGVVEVRVQGLTEVTLRAGQAWDRSEDPTVGSATAAVTAKSIDAAPAAAPARPASLASNPRHRHSPPMRSLRTRVERAASHSAIHAEDAAYLRVLALDRAGHVAEARTEARAYLLHFPAGFRRTEMEVFASSTLER